MVYDLVEGGDVAEMKREKSGTDERFAKYNDERPFVADGIWI